MISIHFPTEDEVREAYHQGEEAVVALFREMILDMHILAGRVQKLEDRLASLWQRQQWKASFQRWSACTRHG